MWPVLVLVYLVICRCYDNMSVTMVNALAKHEVVKCGGELTSYKGTIQTPDFPGTFPVPIRCQWIIDASERFSSNTSVVVYLTQLYVTTGLTFTEYAYYARGSTPLGRQLAHTVTEENVTRVHWIWTRSPFLVIDFSLEHLEGNHLRVMDHLLDVYGFNITYEISENDKPVKQDSCNTLLCSFLGNCYADKNYTHFGCSCFEGFSGHNCGQGPGCGSGRKMCENGASCLHMGSDAVLCNCTLGFTGRRCEIPFPDPKDTEECGDSGCVFQCPFQAGRDEVCNCPRGPRVQTDRARYEGTFRLANVTALRDNIATREHFSRAFHTLLEKQISKYLRNSNLSKMEDLRLLDITPGGEVTFHFFGGKHDGSKVREALNNLMKRGRLGNVTLVPTHLAFKQEPTLLLQSVRINQGRIVREGDEFILSCIAQGSSYMMFRWYKDGAFVKENKTMRNMWTKLLPMDSDDRYTALLGIEQASHLDEGVYTCQVVDWGVQQCKSLHLQILVRPEVEVIPKSITIERGRSINIKCMSPNDQRHEKFGYNWTKNKMLLQMVPGVEVWEDLYPAGSILKIFNAQRSAEYTCTVHGSVANVAKSVYVEVVNRTVVPLCAEEQTFGISWPETAPDLDAIQDCPVHYLGVARRRCSLRSTYSPMWEVPDFSACTSDTLENIYNTFRKLVLGYENTTVPEILSACLRYLTHRSSLYPGEGEGVLDLLHTVVQYVNYTGDNESLMASAQSFYKIINFLLETSNSVISTRKITLLQELVKTEALLWSSLLTTNANYAYVNLSSLALHITLQESSMYRLHLNTSSLFPNKLDVEIESPHSDAFGNGTFSIIAIIYRNLTEFLPTRYITKLSNGDEMEFEINSRVVTVEVGSNGQRFVPTQGVFHVDLYFEHIVMDYDTEEWNISCGVTYVAASDQAWDLASCITRTTGTNITRCSCNRPGTYAALLTTKLSRVPQSVSQHYHTVVVVGCVCCLVQTMFTLLVLLPYWWHYRTCLVFLKLQCCTATSGAMGVFIYAVRDSLPKTSFPYVTTSLEAFLLIGMSSHLSKVMIVYTEVVQVPKLRHMKETVVTIITGVPVLAVLCNQLAHHSTGWQLKSWWLLWGTLLFNIFIASAVVMIVLFVFLYFIVMRRLRLLSSRSTIGSKAIGKRVGLLRRAGIIFFVMVMMEASSVFYINVADTTCHYVFSLTSALLGFTIFLCYILKSETPLYIHVLQNLKLENAPEEDYSSESVNSPLRFFTKEEGDAESEAAPPRPGSPLGMTGDDNQVAPREGLLMVETTNKCFQRTSTSDEGPSTIETFIHSIEGSVEEVGNGRVVYQGSDRLLLKPDGSNVDLECYENSPPKYMRLEAKTSRENGMLSEYVEQDVGLPDSGEQCRFVRGYVTPRPEPARCYIREQTPPPESQQHILTTHVCVELGVVTSDCQDSGCPAIVLCSVDVEPCHRGEMTAVVEASACRVNGGPFIMSTEQQESTKEVMSEDINDSQAVGQEIPTQEPDMSEGKENRGEERQQPEGKEKPQPPVSSAEAEDDVMDRISHDLDYLLNRKPAQDDGSVLVVPKCRRTSVTGAQNQIQEEEEEEEEAAETDIVGNSDNAGGKL